MADDTRTAEPRSSRTPWNKGKLTGPKPSIRPTSRRRGKAGQKQPLIQSVSYLGFPSSATIEKAQGTAEDRISPTPDDR